MLITTYKEFLKESDNYYTEDEPEYYGIFEYKWNNGLLDVYQNVNKLNRVNKIAFNFGKINGDFDCSNLELTSLKGCPVSISGDFKCDHNLLQNLLYAPKIVGGNYKCHNNKLTSLEGCPEKVNGDFYCYDNNYLSNLYGAPKIIEGNFSCSTCHSLSKLEGGPKIVRKYYGCDNLPLPINNENYPLCIIGSNITEIHDFRKIHSVIKENEDKFIHLIDNKIAFHQMVMRLNPELISNYNTITPPSKKTIL